MLSQYLSVKAQAGDAVLFFRLGDFYEMFFEDAERVAPLLDLTLTSRNKDDPNPIPMCGVPHHAAQGYISKLVAHGLRVAICDQLGDPTASPGLVERGLTRVITPGTVLDEEEGLADREPGYLVALSSGGEAGTIAIAAVEVSTGEVRCCLAPGRQAAEEELRRIQPREVLVPAGDREIQALAAASGLALTERAAAAADARGSGEAATRKGGTHEGATRVNGACAGRLEAPFDLAQPGLAAVRGALAMAISYVKDTVRGGLQHLRAPLLYSLGAHLMCDERTRKNLALVEDPSGRRGGTLWGVLDRTATPMGSRRLRDWLLYPLLDLGAIGERLDAVEELVDAPGLRADFEAGLRKIGDLERLVGRIGTGRAGPRELLRLGRCLEHAQGLVEPVRRLGATLVERLAAEMVPPPGLARRLLATIADSPPLAAAEGGAIRDGADAEVDRLRGLTRDAQRLLSDLEARERAATGIGSLKIRYHRVLGYFFEVTKTNLGLVPERFTRRQSMATGERFTTPELLELERQLETADDLCRRREVELFSGLLAELAGLEQVLSALARALGSLDALVSLAAVAHDHGYVRPRLHRGSRLEIKDGRHPVVERTSAEGRFVPNDTLLDDDSEQLAILTGPNMAGKSTYLRQVALIVLLAHVGSFVPAAEASVPLTDRIWTRVGAADDLVAGDSTFMVEMKETAAILGNLTPRTLVVLDEIGRGTSTYDGIAIAWAVAEHLHDFAPAPGARVKTLFATHFHELTALAESRPRVRNYSVAVREWKDEVLFLRKVVPGPTSRSYGVAVARLAGIPESVVARARSLLRDLEAGRDAGGAAAGRLPGPRSAMRPEPQLSLFSAPADQLRLEIRAIDVERLTPLDALHKLHELAEKARQG